MTTMPTKAQVPPRHSWGTVLDLDITARGRPSLLRVFHLLFDERFDGPIWESIDDDGYHLAFIDAIDVLRSDNSWEHRSYSVGQDGRARAFIRIIDHIEAWMEEMDRSRLERLLSDKHFQSHPDLNLDNLAPLMGFRATTEFTPDGFHWLLTVVPVAT